MRMSCGGKKTITPIVRSANHFFEKASGDRRTFREEWCGRSSAHAYVMRWQEGDYANCTLYKRPLRRIIVSKEASGGRRTFREEWCGRSFCTCVCHAMARRREEWCAKLCTCIVASALFGESLFRRRRLETVALFGRNGAVEFLHMRMPSTIFGESSFAMARRQLRQLRIVQAPSSANHCFEGDDRRPSHFSGGMVRSKFCTCVCHAMARRRLRQSCIVQAPLFGESLFRRRRLETVALFGRNGAVEVLHMRMSCDGKKATTPIDCTSALFGIIVRDRCTFPEEWCGRSSAQCHRWQEGDYANCIVQAPSSANHCFEGGD